MKSCLVNLAEKINLTAASWKCNVKAWMSLSFHTHISQVCVSDKEILDLDI